MGATGGVGAYYHRGHPLVVAPALSVARDSSTRSRAFGHLVKLIGHDSRWTGI